MRESEREIEKWRERGRRREIDRERGERVREIEKWRER